MNQEIWCQAGHLYTKKDSLAPIVEICNALKIGRAYAKLVAVEVEEAVEKTQQDVLIRLIVFRDLLEHARIGLRLENVIVGQIKNMF